MDREAVSLLALMMCPGVGCATAQRIRAMAYACDRTVSDLMALAPRSLAKLLPPDSAALGAALRQARDHLEEASVWMGRAINAGARSVTADMPEYPEELGAFLAMQAPPLLFCRGNVSVQALPLAGIVGTRTPSPRGVSLARRCADLFCAQGAAIVSGGAAGIDTAAHEAALERGGATVIILPQGILTYSTPHAFGQALDEGRALILSQFAPAAPWATHAAVTRNDTIAALARTVCVLEPRKTGGSIRTGRCALAQGKPVFCAPDANFPESEATLRRAGAQPLLASGRIRTEALRAALDTSPAPHPKQATIFGD